MPLGRRDVLAGGAAALILGAAARAAGSAAETVADEAARAAQDGKRLLLVFEASWCTWCIPMDAMLVDPAAREILETHFRIMHLRAQERDGAERAKQLPGADDVYLEYAMGGAGLPFSAVLDADAQPVTTSVTAAVNGENFGFPVTGEELEGFERMLETGAPAMSAEDRAALRAACVRAFSTPRT